MKKLFTLIFLSVIIINNINAQCGNVNMATGYARNANARHMQTNEYIITENKPSQAGSVWYNNFLSLDGDFSLEFEIYLGKNDGGADGLAFVLQRSVQGTTALSTGGGIGYKGISPSLCVEYDTWWNDNYKDPNYDHIAITKNGSVTHEPNSGFTPVKVSNMEDGKYHKTKIMWQAASKLLSVYWEEKQIISQVIDVKGTIFENNPKVYWGWTGATGAAYNEQKIKLISSTFQEVLFPHANLIASTCNIGGSIDLSVAGGFPPYSFTWSNGAITEDISGLNPGNYTVYIIDACKNNTTITFTITGQTIIAGEPVLQCPNDLVLDNTPGQCATYNVIFDKPVLINSCEEYSIIQTSGLPSSSTFPMGNTVNVFSVMLPDGKTKTCSFNVTVR